ncbi:MAG: fibronectin type III domain-containing protein, partial [Thermoplasmata archaeon]|nr:fibronectin type III domain-containing protein [Thermoplasmata archaeon]
LSNVINDTTLGLGDSTLPGQITDLQAADPTSNSINLTWTAPANNGSVISSGSVSEYEIRYHTEEITNASWVAATIFSQVITPQSPGIQEQIIISGLQPNTTYYFAVRARDTEFNWGWVSNSPYNTTLPGPDVIPPAVIDDLMVVDLKETSLNLTWTAPGDDGITGTATEYDIR